MAPARHQPRRRVVIAGGGVAALEALAAVRALAGTRVNATLLAPEHDHRYRPMTVAEPFSLARARSFPLERIAADFGATFRRDALERVVPAEHRLVTSAGERVDYDALVVACGTRRRPGLAGALTMDDHTLGATFRGLVQDIELGPTRDVAFVAPAATIWPLALYDLALLTAHRAYEMCVDVELSIVTPERAPLAIFGDAVSATVAALLDGAGIAFRGDAYVERPDGERALRPGVVSLATERIVTLPLLDGPRIAGLPADPHGFIPVTRHGEVRGAEDVYAAGDATSFPIKHGAIAAQQADAVAAAIAARAGAPVEPEPFRPQLDAMLLTGAAPLYLSAKLDGAGELRSAVTGTCPSAAAATIAARHLAPYLFERDRAAADRAAADHGLARAA